MFPPGRGPMAIRISCLVLVLVLVLINLSNHLSIIGEYLRQSFHRSSNRNLPVVGKFCQNLFDTKTRGHSLPLASASYTKLLR